MQAAPTHVTRDPALDGLRGLAVLLVFIFHFGGGLRSPHPLIHVLGLIAESGWIGVVLFFALSGFLITGSLWDSRQQPHHLRNFYARRALRILPLYYFVLLLVTLASLARGATFVELRPFALFALFLQNIPGFTRFALVNPSPVPLYHLWSIAVEEQFYLLWPALLLFTAKRSAHPQRSAIKLSLAIFAAVLLYLFIVYGCAAPFAEKQSFDSFLLTHAGALVLGAALALYLRSPSAVPIAGLQRWAKPALLVGIALYVASSFIARTFYLTPPLQFMLGLPGISLAAAALIPIALTPGLVRSALSIAALRWVGRISYGVYVYQLLLQPIIHRLTSRLLPTSSGNLYFALRFVVALFLTLAAACVSFHLIEKPFLRLKRRFPMQQPLPSSTHV